MTPELIAWVDAIIRVPYVLNGRNPAAGFDCLGMLLHFYRDFLKLPVFDDTELVPAGWQEDPRYADYMERLIKAHCEVIREPEPYCIVLMAPPGHFLANHVGVYLGEDKVLQTSERTGVTLMRLDAIKKTNQLRGLLRVKE